MYISRFTSDPLVLASVDDSYLKQLGFFLKSSPGRSDVQLGLRTTPLISHRIQLRKYYIKGCPPNRPSSNDQTLQVPFGLLALTPPLLSWKPNCPVYQCSCASPRWLWLSHPGVRYQPRWASVLQACQRGVHPSLLWFAQFPLPRLPLARSSGLSFAWWVHKSHTLWDTSCDTTVLCSHGSEPRPSETRGHLLKVCERNVLENKWPEVASLLLIAVEIFFGGGSQRSRIKKPSSRKDLCALLPGCLGPSHPGTPVIELQRFPGAAVFQGWVPSTPSPALSRDNSPQSSGVSLLQVPLGQTPSFNFCPPNRKRLESAGTQQHFFRICRMHCGQGSSLLCLPLQDPLRFFGLPLPLASSVLLWF